ncbi:MAG: biotin--[Clostridia bacterium]|nr:biotin--[acetyl-CoA-carboxylase] ligase [Clostridia bacterium]
MTDQMMADRITSHLDEESRKSYRICVMDEMTSTNTVLKQMASDGAPTGTVLIACRQTGGRGRLGRAFHSPDGGLYMSILVRPEIAPADALLLTTSTAVACAEAIDTVCGYRDMDSLKRAKIKWVNDIYVNEKKVCGILAESVFSVDGSRLSHAVIGIGINLIKPTEGFPSSIAATADALFSAHDAVFDDAGPLLAAQILFRMRRHLLCPCRDHIEEYRARSFLTGRRVAVHPRGSLGDAGERIASVLGIDDAFGLIVRYENGDEAIVRSGEVILQEDGTAQLGASPVHIK